MPRPDPSSEDSKIVLDRRGRKLTITPTDLKAAALLVELGTVQRPSAFGEMLIKCGILRNPEGRRRYKAQGLALMGGKVLVRLRRFGLAQDGIRGYTPTEAARQATHGVICPPTDR